MKSRFAFTFTALFLPLVVQVHSADSALWKDYLDSKAGKSTPVLPDFSYAGYAHGDKPLPKIAGPVFRVEDYGAKANDEVNDSEAIQKAVDACAAAGGGVVLFSKGVYLINEDLDTATKPRILVSNSGVVFRGAGKDAQGTVLYSPKEMQPENPQNMWTGRPPIAARGFSYGGKKAKIKKSAPMNSFEIALNEDHTFSVGDRLMIRMIQKGEAAAAMIAPRVWEERWKAGVYVREFHEIAEVRGAVVRLAEPLMIPIGDPTAWDAQEVKFISNVGFENLRFRGAWKGKFVHHRSWLDDSGWRGLQMVGVENSWIDQCVFEDMNWALHVQLCRQVTVQNVDIIGTPAHFGMQVSSTYGILGYRVLDLAGEHHGPSLQSGSCATVYRECTWRDNGSFDSHANNPYATLHDQNTGGLDLSGVGGEQGNFPHHLHGLVLWNLKVPVSPRDAVDFWSAGKGGYPRTFSQVLIAGQHGAEVSYEADSVFKNESPGEPVNPPSLYLAQLKHRLGILPEMWAERKP